MDSLAMLSTSWTSGLNAYLTVLLLGLSGRLGFADTPEPLQHGWVIAAAGIMFAIEFVVDKVPYLDSAWDVVHTVIRPVIAAVVGAAIAGGSIGRPGAAALGAALGLDRPPLESFDSTCDQRVTRAVHEYLGQCW